MSVKCTIRIKLLSDICVSDGSSYNSMLDTDICTDSYGFPYIPAKRLRGCLRECAVELSDWDDDIRVDTLFGDKGDSIKRAKLRIGNAYLENYDQLRTFAIDNRGHVLVHPQNILSAYTYIRTQTSIDYKTGVADDKSLRTMRVADKDLVFIADAEVEDEFYSDLDKCCKILRHMGIARTRGLGEVEVSLMKAEKRPPGAARHEMLTPGANMLTYEIDLLEPVICKSINGGESRTLDYIEGAKILGLIANDLTEDYLEFMGKGDLKCLNAYISKNGIRFTEVPGYIYKIKNDKRRYVNKLAETDQNRKETENLQLNQMKHTYAVIEEGKLITADVMTEERYHHRRPDDKSIGRATANEDGDADFYQMDSISDGQQFAGIVTGSKEQIAEVYRIMTQDKDFYIGYSRSSEYGRVRIRVTGTGIRKDRETRPSRNLVVCLNSPAIVYSENAMPTTSPDSLTDEILISLGIEEKPESTDRFIRNTTLGGYNVTWKMRKPTVLAFDKGTAVRMTFAGDVDVPEGQIIMLGERTAEGYGEAYVSIFDPDRTGYVDDIIDRAIKGRKDELDASSDFAGRIAEPLLDAYIKNRAIREVRGNAEKICRNASVYRPTVSNMILMIKESSSIEEVRESVRSRYEDKIPANKKKKGEAAKAILDHVVESSGILEEFCNDMHITGLQADPDELLMRYLKEYLTQIKYILRGGAVK